MALTQLQALERMLQAEHVISAAALVDVSVDIVAPPPRAGYFDSVFYAITADVEVVVPQQQQQQQQQ